MVVNYHGTFSSVPDLKKRIPGAIYHGDMNHVIAHFRNGELFLRQILLAGKETHKEYQYGKLLVHVSKFEMKRHNFFDKEKLFSMFSVTKHRVRPAVISHPGSHHDAVARIGHAKTQSFSSRPPRVYHRLRSSLS